MLNTININLKTDIKADRPTSLPITLMSQDKNNNQFILRFTNGGESVTLDDTYSVEILTKFTKSGTSRLTAARVRQGYATWEFDTAYITQDETVYNYVYVRKSGSLVVSADSNAFHFVVGLSEIDKDARRVAETYDENYQKYLDEFKGNVDFEEIAQSETERIQAEQARKEAETLREANYEQLIDTALIEADVVGKVDNKVTELTPQINDLTAQLAQTVRKGAITKNDFDTSSDSKKIGLNNLNDEARQAMTGNSPVFEGIPAKSLVEEYFADGSVTDRVIDYVNADKINHNIMRKPYFSKFPLPSHPDYTSFWGTDTDGNLINIQATTRIMWLDNNKITFPSDFKYSVRYTVDKTKIYGALIGFLDSNKKRLMFGYEPSSSYQTAVLFNDTVAPTFKCVVPKEEFTSGEYTFEIGREHGRFYIKLNDERYNVSDFFPNVNFVPTMLRIQLKGTDTGLVVKDTSLLPIANEQKINTTGLKQYSEIGKQAGRNVHIYQFGGKGNDWCYVYTPQGYNPDREKPYPFVIQNHGNGSNFDGTPRNTIWTTIAQYRPQVEYDTNPTRFLLSPSPELNYSSPTIEALLDAGYVVCGAMNYDDNLYGNNNCRNAMVDFYQHMIKNYNVEEKVNLMGASNGFMTTLSGAYLLGGVARVKAIIGVYPLADLIEHYFNYPNHQSQIESAYGIPTGLTEEEFKSVTRTHNYETMNTNFPPIKMWYSLGDSVTVAQYNTLALAQKLENDYLIHEEVEVTGSHGDQSHFEPLAIVEWFNRYS